jgi:hypothetical protein
MLAIACLLGFWVAIELLQSSRWLEIRSILNSSQSRSTTVTLPPMRELVPARARVWFAPYTTFPETGMLESRSRQGVYDTFLAFPPGGITANYGAFKLSPADSAFAQVASGGLPREAAFARQLGYRWFAVDLGAIEDPEGLRRLCKSTTGCRLSGDGYALFPLDGMSSWRTGDLAPHRRLLAELPQRSAAPRWGSLVFEPGRWWAGTEPGAADSAERSTVWVKPVWESSLFRFAAQSVPAPLQTMVTPKQERIWLRLAPGISGVDVCLQPLGPRWRIGGAAPCRPIQLRRKQPRVDITPWLPRGRVTSFRTEWIYDTNGLPMTPSMLPPSGPGMMRPSAFAVEVESP